MTHSRIVSAFLLATLALLAGCEKFVELDQSDYATYLQESIRNSFETWHLVGSDSDFYYLERRRGPELVGRFKLSRSLFEVRPDSPDTPRLIKAGDIHLRDQ